MIKQVHRTALSHLRATFDIKQDSQDIIQPKNNKMWCDQHRYNDTHESKDCYFLNKKNNLKTNKLNLTEIRQKEATDISSDTDGN